MRNDAIVLKGMKENNLKNIDLTLPKGKILVFTGLSGSGKSSVVFDTIARESRRLMTMNYPQYVRNQMPRYERPNTDIMQNLSPVVVIEQKAVSKQTRSTLGTYMDIHPLIRLLFSRIGQPRIESALDFSHQSSFGKCPTCNGFGQVIKPDADKLIDFDKSLRNYAIQFKPLSPSGWQGRWMMTGGLFDPDKAIKDYSEAEQELLIHGPPAGEKVFAPFHTKHGPQPHEWDGLLPRFMRLYINRDISTLRQISEADVLQMTTQEACTTCFGSGLNPEVLASKINGLNIAQYDQLELAELLQELEKITDKLGKGIAQQIIPSIERLMELGLSYLSLSRKMNTLSGGEAQRVKIARHLGSGLNNLIYIFDEPSAGLHPEEIHLLIHMIRSLKAQANTVIVIEHDLSIIEIADEIIEVGPGAGLDGGEIVYQGKMEGLPQSAAHTRVGEHVHLNVKPRKSEEFFTLENANSHHLKNITIDIPKHVLVSICGVSGSGKSTLMMDEFTKKYPETIWVGQESIGLSSRSTLATYMGIMDNIRKIMAKATGQAAGMFSFNSLGACPVCHGKGIIQPDVAFADPITVTCEACQGARYSDEALSYKYRGKNIAEILALTIDEVADYFNLPKIVHQVNTLKDVGLHYLTLGQTTSSLSGGEVQRLKLASQLQNEGKIYLLDEPSLGLHAKDNEKLFTLFERLIDNGNSVIIIEHQLDFIAASDWVIELGPTGGKQGGYVLFEGRPEEMLAASTPTAKWLRKSVGHVDE